uniref:hypothetical protein n=1 Tax=Bacillus multifaciens TaxID=3068506 RepID=UPI003F491A24
MSKTIIELDNFDLERIKKIAHMKGLKAIENLDIGYIISQALIVYELDITAEKKHLYS